MIWDFINFSCVSILDELNGTNIHRLSNILTLDEHNHKNFDNLDLWFEAVPVSAWPTCIIIIVDLDIVEHDEHLRFVLSIRGSPWHASSPSCYFRDSYKPSSS